MQACVMMLAMLPTNGDGEARILLPVRRFSLADDLTTPSRTVQIDDGSACQCCRLHQVVATRWQEEREEERIGSRHALFFFGVELPADTSLVLKPFVMRGTWSSEMSQSHTHSVCTHTHTHTHISEEGLEELLCHAKLKMM